MSSDADLQRDMALAAQAKAVLENPAVELVLDRIERECLEMFADSDPDKPEIREEAYHALQAARWFRDELKTLLDNGAIAARQLEKRNKA